MGAPGHISVLITATSATPSRQERTIIPKVLMAQQAEIPLAVAFTELLTILNTDSAFTRQLIFQFEDTRIRIMTSGEIHIITGP